MKKIKHDLLSTMEEEEKSFRSWSIIFQFRIYTGFVFSILSNFREPGFSLNVLLIAIYTVMYSPFFVCMILFYMKRKAFRAWYIVGAAVIIAVNMFSGIIPAVQAVIETFVIVALFKWNYVNKHFIPAKEEKQNNLQTVEETEN